MKFAIRPASNDDIEELIQLSLLAWAPVFISFEQVLGSKIYSLLYPDWQKQQSEVVKHFCKDDEKTIVWVAELEGIIAGFIAYTLNIEDKSGEVELLAVHPEYQNRGIGTQLNKFVLAKMKENGIKLAVVGTGGDTGHAPARTTYEKAGYTPCLWFVIIKLCNSRYPSGTHTFDGNSDQCMSQFLCINNVGF
ncbi:GNAT family N-acetyltransferase [Dictyobacter vulcani]|uniref:GNAT family N-acetyltransferase n=1 Tax=Dictyobacter vulcani TaxID=2607529 RepID=A0A5J4KY10_9CHLR|nr:GNAT family N-acetyltransferase [Dictyobacter vulcani]GER91420.1 GNAT family N-acetyltransferase [Dictyobacter vulcani]